MHAVIERAARHWEMVAPLIDTPQSVDDYEALMINIEQAIELYYTDQNINLVGLIKAMAHAAETYEDRSVLIKESSGLDALRYLVKLHQVHQTQLKNEIGSQGVVSEILNGKRKLTLRHVKGLARRFKVSPNTFIDL